MDAKNELLEIIDFVRYRVENGCTKEEIDSWTKLLSEQIDAQGTIDDFSKFYGKSKDAVNSVIKRRMIEKPKRNVVLYSFMAFRKILPSSWRKNNS